MGGIDLAVTISYLVFIVTLGCSAAYWNRRRGKGEAEDYFLAGGTLRWPIIGLALFATNISCVHLVSLAQSGYDTGLLNGQLRMDGGVHADHARPVLRTVLHSLASADAAGLSGTALLPLVP